MNNNQLNGNRTSSSDHGICKIEVNCEHDVCQENCDQNNNRSNRISDNDNTTSMTTTTNTISSSLCEKESKTAAAKKVVSVITKGDFQELLNLLRFKPDLNVFINGQTALHYCLLLGT